MSDGPPPVPGGRSPRDREAARRERAARRAAARGQAPPAAPPPEEPRDWLAEAERLTAPPPPPSLDGAGPRRRAPRWGRIVALGAVVLVLGGVAWFLVSLFQPFKGDGEGTVRVAIPQGASLGEIGDLLESRGVVSSSTFFQLRARLAGRSNSLKPGSYTLARDMKYTSVLDKLEQGLPPNVVRVVIPEGLSRKEIAPRVAGLRGSYIKATRSNPELNPRQYKAKNAKSLEGFLFPATYELKRGQPVSRLVSEQLQAFKRSFAGVDLRYARSKNLTPYDVLTIASLIEREVQVPKERKLVASVIYNRLHDGIRLDIDATTRFVVGKWSGALRESELHNPSPYNTRVHFGLPPGPIGNPGIASIQAAAHPAKTNYLFYVAAVCGNGSHKFAATDAQFQRYVEQYNRARDKRGGKSPTEC
ncbi:MAG TPA: endolytic transglycosylase MltG [Thermoleophilaceae bacterium]|nr:endolytic transglycosylase MltG [Thermoleophilaceae bacterium]